MFRCVTASRHAPSHRSALVPLFLVSALLAAGGVLYLARPHVPVPAPASASGSTPGAMTAGQPPGPPGKVFVVGLDGASWKHVQILLGRGDLPNMARLVREGVSGPLASFLPCKSPALWTSVATGKNVDKHGIGAHASDKGGNLVRIGVEGRTARAFWNILGDRGFGVGIVNWWVTTPPEKVNGFMVSDSWRTATPDTPGPLTYPPDLLGILPEVDMPRERYLAERLEFGLPGEAVAPPGSSHQVEMMYEVYEGFWEQDRAVREASRRLLERGDVDVFAAVFRVIDVSSHLFWINLDPAMREEMTARIGLAWPPEHEARIDDAFASVMAPVYRYADLIVGDFLAKAGPDTSIIVCSDHGFRIEGDRYGHDGGDGPPEGVIVLWGPPFRKGARVEAATLLDITPTLLYAQGVPTGKDMDGKVLYPAFTPAFLAGHAPSSVESHETGERPAGDARPVALPPDVIEELRALGYVE